MRFHLLCCLLAFLCTRVPAQTTLADRLGYPEGTKLLIVHADDLAVTHATNVASFRGLDTGLVTSASVMANCPWLPEVARYATDHPGVDLGMHLTLTSEWRDLKWGSVAPAGRVPSLLNEYGYLRPDCQSVSLHASPAEVEIELRAQINRALRLGIRPTHLDSHMGCLIFNPEFFAIYLAMGREFGIPAMVTRNELQQLGPDHQRLVREDDLLLDYLFTAGYGDYQNGLEDYYRRVLRELPPGVSILLIHTALDGGESAGMAGGVEGWGNRWRQLDYNFFTGAAFRELLREHDIQLTSWAEIHRKWRAR